MSYTKKWRYTEKKQCIICGEEFDVEFEEEIIFTDIDFLEIGFPHFPYYIRNKRILTKGASLEIVIKKGVGDWVAYELIDNLTFKRCIPWYKFLYYKLRDFKRQLFHQYEEVELWICPKCNELNMGE
jgi:hypothetical protein